jgi:putative FmdB family regulatory protein
VCVKELSKEVITKSDDHGASSVELRSRRMPIYEFECEGCGARFEELVATEADVVCEACGSGRIRRLYATVAPPGRQPRGAKVRSDESRRREREAARQDRLSESRKRRALGEKP